MAIKHYVLDTNVLLHDPSCVLGFDDNTIVISPVVLEELDAIKSQSRMVSPDARQAIRMLESIVEGSDPKLLGSKGVERNEVGGRLMIPALKAGLDLVEGVRAANNDQRIIRDALLLRTASGSSEECMAKLAGEADKAPAPDDLETIFVSRDLNARLMARAHGLLAEDFKGAQVKADNEEIPSGVIEVDRELIDVHLLTCDNVHYRFNRKDLEADLGLSIHPHLMIAINDAEFFRVTSVTDAEVVCMHRNMGTVQSPFDLQPKNLRQAMAIDVTMDEEVPLVILTGGAGSGKTLLSLAMGMEKMMAGADPRNRPYQRIIVARSSDGLDDDIGALPGTEEDTVNRMACT